MTSAGQGRMAPMQRMWDNMQAAGYFEKHGHYRGWLCIQAERAN